MIGYSFCRHKLDLLQGREASLLSNRNDDDDDNDTNDDDDDHGDCDGDEGRLQCPTDQYYHHMTMTIIYI